MSRSDPSLRMLVERAIGLLSRPSVLVASDFDGTLAEVRSDPWAARIHAPSQRALRRLAVTPGVRVVLFSGRTVLDLAGRARVGGVTYLGDHGVERADVPRGFRPGSVRVTTRSAAGEHRHVARFLADAVPRDVPEPWLVVEPKSAAVSFHFRTAPDLAAATHRIMRSADRHDPLAVLERHVGRSAIELRPPDASSKAASITGIMAELDPDAIIVLGDGIDDAAAFRAVAAAARRSGIASLCLAVAAHPEVTPHVAPHADGLLCSPRAVAILLGAMARHATGTRAERSSGGPSGGPLAESGARAR